jgi:hypothetical protein
MRRGLAVALVFGILSASLAARADAQFLGRSWVSGTGNDANSCERTAPCRTFAGAFGKTGATGLIACLDAGDFGAIIITKSITIDCTGTMATIFQPNPEPAVVVDCDAGCRVTLRNLDIGDGVAFAGGVEFRSGQRLILEQMRIHNSSRPGVVVRAMAAGVAGRLIISNSTITNVGNAVETFGGTTIVSHSVLTGNSIALFAGNDGVIDADNNVLAFNSVAVRAGIGGTTGDTGATVRLSNNDIYSNDTGFACGGGILASAGNNRKGNNTGGNLPTCSPTVAISQQ